MAKKPWSPGDDDRRMLTEHLFYFDQREWAHPRPGRPAVLSAALRKKVGWGVAHLTYDRAWSTPQDKHWSVMELACALAPAVIFACDGSS
jgi:hypothetical protein